MSLTAKQLGAIIHLQSLDYPPHETCRDLGISEVEFWETLAESHPAVAFETAYVISRDNRLADKQWTEEEAVRVSEVKVAALRKVHQEAQEMKMEIIEDALALYGAKPCPEQAAPAPEPAP
jgi:hypothetical protein